jgi:hypothetical protein
MTEGELACYFYGISTTEFMIIDYPEENQNDILVRCLFEKRDWSVYIASC